MGIFTIFIVRERRHFWSSKPGMLLIAISIVAIISFFLMGIFGFILPKLGIYPILFLIGISLISTVISDYPKYYLFIKLNI